MLCGFHFKDTALLTMYKRQDCCAVQRYDIYIWQKLLCTYTTLIRNIPQTELSSVFINNNRHVDAYQQACEWPLKTFAVPSVRTRNVVYYPDQQMYNMYINP